jgi:inhibitor of KinA
MRKNIYKLSYKLFDENSILIEWPKKIDVSILNDILLFKKKISLTITNIKTVNAYQSLLVQFNYKIDNLNIEFNLLNSIYLSIDHDINIQKIKKNWKIPVCYEGKFSFDLKEIAEKLNIATSKIIKMHYMRKYTVYFIGFLPGFLYLGGLNQKLKIPRKQNPLNNYLEGSIGIAENQTGIYPSQSPGGWSVIGNTPIKMFNPSNKHPCFVKAGDTIEFYPINSSKHTEIKVLSDNFLYNLDQK